MKLDMIKNTRRNLIWGVLLRGYQILIPLIIRWIFISRLGVEYAGLGGLFSAVLNFLNLAEMGVQSAVIFFMYKPIAENDTETVRRLLGLISRCYKWISLIVLSAGLALTPFVGYLISGVPPVGINIYVIFLINILSSALSYWPAAYKVTIFSVHQRNDIVSRISLITLNVKYVLQLIVLIFVGNYYTYLAVEIVTKLIERLITVLIVNRKYPMYKTALTPTQEMNEALGKKTSALFLHKIGGIIVNSADAIVISAFLGLTVLGKYQNYYSIMLSVIGFVLLLNSSSQAGIGNKLAVSEAVEIRHLFDNYNFLIFSICSVCCSCFLNLYQPFITLWLGADMLLDNGIVAVLCVYFYVFLLMMPGNSFENARGLWQYDRHRPLLEGILNLSMNLILVRFIGLYGILLSTIFSMLFFSIPWLYYNVTKQLFGGGFRRFIRDMILYMASAAAICMISYLVCGLIPDSIPLVADLLVKGILSVFVPVALIYIFYHKRREWKWMCEIGYKMFRRINKQK